MDSEQSSQDRPAGNRSALRWEQSSIVNERRSRNSQRTPVRDGTAANIEFGDLELRRIVADETHPRAGESAAEKWRAPSAGLGDLASESMFPTCRRHHQRPV